MSSTSSTAEVAADIRLYYAYDYCTAVASAVILYDYALTISREVNTIWSAQPTGAVLVFYSGRCAALAYSIFNALLLLSSGNVMSCEAIAIGNEILILVLYTTWAAFSSLRVFATTGRSWLLSGLTGLLALAPLGADLAIYAQSSYGISWAPILGQICDTSYNMSIGVIAKVSIVARACLIASDILVLCAIMFYTRNMNKTSLATTSLLRRDGLQYFLLLLLLNVLDMVLFSTNVFENVTSSFIIPITSIVVSRCLISLREGSKSTDVESQMSTMNFARSPTDVVSSDQSAGCSNATGPVEGASESTDIIELSYTSMWSREKYCSSRDMTGTDNMKSPENVTGVQFTAP